MDYRDYYATLGVSRTASQAEIKKAFRRLARKHHPDVNKTDTGAEARFKEINEAYAVLGEDDKRRAYDALGQNWDAYQRSGAAGGAGGAGGNPFAGFGGASGGPSGIRFEYHGNPEDLAGFSDFFRTYFAAGGSPSGGGAAGGGSSRRRTARTTLGDVDLESLLGGLSGTGFAAAGGGFRPGGAADPALFTIDGRNGAAHGRQARQDVEGDVEISLEEALQGTERVVQVADRRLEVKIPPGVETGRRIRLSGKAGSGAGAGHVYLTVRVLPHPVFTRDGADLSRELPITLGEALLGAEVPVPTLTGRVLLRIPPETQTGRTFRLARQGMPRFAAEGRGDLYVKTRVVLPADLDEEGRRLAVAFTEHLQQPDPRSPRGGASSD